MYLEYTFSQQVTESPPDGSLHRESWNVGQGNPRGDALRRFFQEFSGKLSRKRMKDDKPFHSLRVDILITPFVLQVLYFKTGLFLHLADGGFCKGLRKLYFATRWNEAFKTIMLPGDEQYPISVLDQA